MNFLSEMLTNFCLYGSKFDLLLGFVESRSKLVNFEILQAFVDSFLIILQMLDAIKGTLELSLLLG